MIQWFETCRMPDPGFGLDALCGCAYWKALFKGCLPEPALDGYFGVSSSHSFLLYGSAGNGKRTLAMALAGELYKIGYELICVPGMILEGATSTQTCKNIKECFGAVISGAMAEPAAGCCLFVEDLAPICKDGLAAWTLSDCVARAEDGELPMIIVASVEQLSDVPRCLQKAMLPCGVGCPDAKERRAFLENVFEGRIPRSSKLKYGDMVQMTEGFNYGALTRISVLAGMLMKQYALELYGAPEQAMEALGSGGLFMSKDMFEQIIGQLRADGAGYGGMAASAEDAAGRNFGGLAAGEMLSGNGLAGISDVPVAVTNESKDFMSAFDDMDIDAL